MGLFSATEKGFKAWSRIDGYDELKPFGFAIWMHCWGFLKDEMAWSLSNKQWSTRRGWQLSGFGYQCGCQTQTWTENGHVAEMQRLLHCSETQPETDGALLRHWKPAEWAMEDDLAKWMCPVFDKQRRWLLLRQLPRSSCVFFKQGNCNTGDWHAYIQMIAQ